MRSLGEIVNRVVDESARLQGVALMRAEAPMPSAAEAEFMALLAAARAAAPAAVAFEFDVLQPGSIAA